MKKLLLIFFISLGLVSPTQADTVVNLPPFKPGVFYLGDLIFNAARPSPSMKQYEEGAHYPRFDELPIPSAEGYDLEAVYLDEYDAEFFSFLMRQPVFNELVTVNRLRGSYKQKYVSQNIPYSLFEKEVENTISDLLRAEELLEEKAAEIATQEEQVLSQAGGAEDKTIRVLMPSGPFIFEDDAFAFSFVNYTHQTKDNLITESSRIVSTLILFIENEFINVGFYKTVSPEDAAKELNLEAEKVKRWYALLDVYKQIKSPSPYSNLE